MAFSPLGAVSDVTIFVKLLIPDVNPQVNWLRCRQHEISSDLPLIAAQTMANSWAEFRCMRTFLVLQGIIYTQLQTSCVWVAAEHRSHPLVGGNSWARILSFTHVEALHAEAVGPGNWNVLKRNGSQGIFCSRLSCLSHQRLPRQVLLSWHCRSAPIGYRAQHFHFFEK